MWRQAILFVIAVLVLLAPSYLLAEEPPVLEWVKGAPAGNALAVNQAGEIYLAGGDGVTKILIKYNSSGEVLWTATETGIGLLTDVAVVRCDVNSRHETPYAATCL